jgi:hypothetical protein
MQGSAGDLLPEEACYETLPRQGGQEAAMDFSGTPQSRPFALSRMADICADRP